MLIWVEHMLFFEVTPTLTKGCTRVVSREGCCSSLWGPVFLASVQLLFLHGAWIKQLLAAMNRRLAQDMLLLCLIWLSLILERINPVYLEESVELSTYHIKIFQGAVCFVSYFLPLSGPYGQLSCERREKQFPSPWKEKPFWWGQGSFRTIIFQTQTDRCNLLD